MLTSLLARIAMGVATKLMTSTFVSKLLIATLSAWAKKSENKWDDQVVIAMAEALEVPLEQLKGRIE